MKKFLIATLVIVLIAGALFGALVGFGTIDLKPKPVPPVVDNSVEVLVDQTYGTFTIPKESMFLTVGGGDVCILKGTNITAILDTVKAELVSEGKQSDDYEIFIKDAEWFNVDAYLTATAFKGPEIAGFFQFKNNILDFDSERISSYRNGIPCPTKLKVVYTAKSNIDYSTNNFIDNMYETSVFNKNPEIMCVPIKIAVGRGSSILEETFPQALTSDMGHVLTRSLYNKLIANKKAV